MNDPFDILREQLVTAARPRRRHGGLVLVALAAVLSITAAAAAVTISGSEPAERPQPKPKPTYVELRPDMTTGSMGWCVSLVQLGVPGGSACSSPAAPERPIIAAGGQGNQTGGLFYAVVNGSVDKLELPNGDRVTARRDPRVPAPWKVVIGSYKGELGPGLRFLDAGGDAVPDRNPIRDTYPGREADPDAPCRLRVDSGTRFRTTSTQMLMPLPTTAPDVVRPSFLSCATTVYYHGKDRLRAAVLLDAHSPTTRAPLLPGLTSEPTGQEIVRTGTYTSARRAGNGWVMVYGADAAKREQLLRALTVRAP